MAAASSQQPTIPTNNVSASDEQAVVPAENVSATVGTRKKTVYVNENVDFPMHATHPDEWRIHPREPFLPTFTPDRPPGSLGCGITPFDSPGTIWCELLSDALPILYEETNRHGGNRCADGRIESYRWEHMTLGEFFKFLGLYMSMGVCRRRNYQDHWLDKGVNATPAYGCTMPLRRFKQIKQNLHFEDNEEAALQGWDEKGGPNHDYIYKIRRFMDKAFAKFRIVWAPGKQIACDELMVKFTGHFFFKVRMPSKPIRKGIKFYFLADSRTGAGLAAVMHAGSYGNEDEGKTFDKVWELLEQAQVLDQGHELYLDNYYTSHHLVNELYDRDTYVVGMIKKNMARDLPPVISDKKSQFSTNMQRGQAVFLHTDKLTLCNWRDSKNAIILYSLPHVVNNWTNCKRKLKKADGKKDKLTVPQPEIYDLYNRYMGGTDIHGQHIASSNRHNKSSYWYTSCGDLVLNAAVTNSYVIMRQGIFPGSQTRLTCHKARTLISADLIKLGKILDSPAPAIPPPQQRNVPGEKRLQKNLQHLPVKIPKRRLCKGHVQAQWTTMGCSECGVPLCLRCFAPYHSLEDYKFDDPKKRNAGIGRKYGKRSANQ